MTSEAWYLIRVELTGANFMEVCRLLLITVSLKVERGRYQFARKYGAVGLVSGAVSR